MGLKKVIKTIAIIGAIALTVYTVNYLRWADDYRIEVNKVYTVDSISEEYFSGITEDKKHHIALEQCEFGLKDIQMGDRVAVTIFIDKILNVREVKK